MPALAHAQDVARPSLLGEFAIPRQEEHRVADRQLTEVRVERGMGIGLADLASATLDVAKAAAALPPVASMGSISSTSKRCRYVTRAGITTRPGR